MLHLKWAFKLLPLRMRATFWKTRHEGGVQEARRDAEAAEAGEMRPNNIVAKFQDRRSPLPRRVSVTWRVNFVQ